MATQALQKAGCISIENRATFPSSIRRGRECAPGPLLFCRNDSSNEKLQGLKHKPSRFPTREEENRGMRFLSARRGGFMCGEDPTASQSSPTCEKLDEWIKDSVIEIVRHIREAPFLHYVFDKSSSSRVLQRHRVSEHMFERSDCWRMIRKSLRDISPDGVILVQRLDQGSACKICFAQGSAGDDHLCSHGKEGQNLDEEGRTDLWGLVIQGRSPGSSACYILKTTQTVSGSGVCIHFCLTRARCFGPSPQVQLANSWLLQSEI